MARTRLALLLALLSAVLPGVAACGGPRRFYEGPPLPADEIATLAVEGGMIGEEQRFDAKLARFDKLPMRTPPKHTEILPGDHEIDIAWVRWAMAPGEKRTWVRLGEGVEHITFEAHEGRAYTIVWDGHKPTLRVSGESGPEELGAGQP